MKRIFAHLLLLALALAPISAQAACWQWSLTAASNATADPSINWSEGMAPSSVNDSARAMMARLAECRDDLSGKLTTTGTSTAYALTTNQGTIAATPGNGQELAFRPHATSGAAATLAVDGGTAFPIQSSPGVAAAIGVLVSGSPYRVTFSTGSSAWLLQDFYATTVNIQTLLDGIGSTRGSILERGASAWTAITPGTAGQIFTSGGAGADPAWAAPVAQLPRGYIDGCITANGDGAGGGDQTNDITFTAGVARDSTNAANQTCNALTKQLDANWVAGNNQGMRDSSSGITTGTYHLYVACTAAPVCDYYAHTSATVATVLTALQAEPGGSGYLYLRHVMSIMRSGGVIRLYTQLSDEILWNVSVNDANATAIGTTSSLVTLTVPAGIKVRALMSAGIDTGSHGLTVRSPDQTDTAVNFTTFFTHTNFGSGPVGSPHIPVRTDTSSRVRVRATTATNLYMMTHGFLHPRGKDQ